MKRPPFGWCGKDLTGGWSHLPQLYCTRPAGHAGPCHEDMVPVPGGWAPVERAPVIELEPSRRSGEEADRGR